MSFKPTMSQIAARLAKEMPTERASKIEAKAKAIVCDLLIGHPDISNDVLRLIAAVIAETNITARPCQP